MAIKTGSKRKIFPELELEDLQLPQVIPITESDDEDTDGDSDEPEAITLNSGRAMADARGSAIQSHQKQLLEKKKASNKAREAFIQSTKPKPRPTSQTERKSPDSKNNEPGAEEDHIEENDSSSDENVGDQTLLDRMQRAMQDAKDEEEDEAASDDDAEEPRPNPFSSSSTRLPDSIFAAAAAEYQKPGRKRKGANGVQEAKLKRRRIRDGPTERVIGGRTIRVTNAPNTPPPPPTRLSRKLATSAKGGASFRRKWKRRDATQAQIRSRSGPAPSFTTSR